VNNPSSPKPNRFKEMQEILDRIKKLLRLGADKAATPAEAELAVQRAFELAARHQIDIESVSLEDDSRRIVSENFPVQARLSFARKKILNLLVAFFNVNVIINRVPRLPRGFVWAAKPSVTFIGKTVDIQIARYVYEFLHSACSAALRDFVNSRASKPARSTQENFVQGFIWGVANKLREAKAQLTEQQNGLIVSEHGRRDQFESGLYKQTDLKPVKSDLRRVNRDASFAGYIEGQKVEIRKPISTNAAGQQLLT
jgi:hypothetical protein